MFCEPSVVIWESHDMHASANVYAHSLSIVHQPGRIHMSLASSTTLLRV